MGVRLTLVVAPVIAAQRQHAVMTQRQRRGGSCAPDIAHPMRGATREQHEIARLQRNLRATRSLDDAFAVQHQMKRCNARLHRRMIDIEAPGEQATQIEAGLRPGEVDQSAERIHETVALKVERIEYSGYRGTAQYFA